MPATALAPSKPQNSPRELCPSRSLHDYLPLRALGSGATGVVFLALHVSSHEPFALKAFRNSQSDSLARAHNEERVLARLRHPFLPSLHSCFDDGEHRFLALDYCSGGDLQSVQRAQPEKTFSLSTIRFYAAEIVLALEYLHENGIVYRDLKPENILLSCDGHIMLTDFDLAVTLPPKIFFQKAIPERKENATSCIPVRWSRNGCIATADTVFRRGGKAPSSPRVTPITDVDTSHPIHRSFSFVGTEEFVAPEIILGTGHDFAVDWWAFGILLYEMRYGQTPFKNATTKETYKAIRTKEVEFTGPWSPLQDLIRRLLVKEPHERLGYHKGAAEVKAHGFFEGIRWDALHDVLRPPLIPTGSGVDFCTAAGATYDVKAHLAKVDRARTDEKARRKIALITK